MKYTDIVSKYLGAVGSISWHDGLCTFCLNAPVSDYEFWKIIEVGDDYVYAREIDDLLCGKGPREVYVHIARFVIKDQGATTNSHPITGVEDQ